MLSAWLLCVSVLLALFFIIDSTNFRQHKVDAAAPTSGRIELAGSHNFLWLLVIIALVLAQEADWLKGVEHWSVMASLGDALGWSAALMARMFHDTVRCPAHDRDGNFVVQVLEQRRPAREPIRFRSPARSGVPIRRHLRDHGAGPLGHIGEARSTDIGITTVRQFYWGSGVLSAMLDNAPTYLNFLTAAFGLQHLSLENPLHVNALLHPEIVKTVFRATAS